MRISNNVSIQQSGAKEWMIHDWASNSVVRLDVYDIISIANKIWSTNLSLGGEKKTVKVSDTPVKRYAKTMLRPRDEWKDVDVDYYRNSFTRQAGGEIMGYLFLLGNKKVIINTNFSEKDLGYMIEMKIEAEIYEVEE